MSDMGIIMSTSYRKSLGIVVSLFVFISIYGQPSTEDSTSLGEAFNAGAPEVEPVGVGRDRWNEKPQNAPSENSSDATDESSQSEESTTTGLENLTLWKHSKLSLNHPSSQSNLQSSSSYEDYSKFRRHFGFQTKNPWICPRISLPT